MGAVVLHELLDGIHGGHSQLQQVYLISKQAAISGT